MVSSSTLLLIVIGLAAGFVVFAYNRLVDYRNRCENALAQIDTQLQRRYELIPNLVNSTKAYLKHENETLTAVIEARNHAKSVAERLRESINNPKVMEQLSQAESGLQQALLNLHAVSEDYPDLKADQTIRHLNEELTSTENRVTYARQAYNDDVLNYNTFKEQFPFNLIAGAFTFQRLQLLELQSPQAREPLRIEL